MGLGYCRLRVFQVLAPSTNSHRLCPLSICFIYLWACVTSFYTGKIHAPSLLIPLGPQIPRCPCLSAVFLGSCPVLYDSTIIYFTAGACRRSNRSEAEFLLAIFSPYTDSAAYDGSRSSFNTTTKFHIHVSVMELNTVTLAGDTHLPISHV